jgi:RNA-directed DNA polymerase
MLREKHKWKPHKCQSTDAEHRGGATRSSDEDPVMGLERRGSIVQLELKKTTGKREDWIETSKAILYY